MTCRGKTTSVRINKLYQARHPMEMILSNQGAHRCTNMIVCLIIMMMWNQPNKMKNVFKKSNPGSWLVQKKSICLIFRRSLVWILTMPQLPMTGSPRGQNWPYCLGERDVWERGWIGRSLECVALPCDAARAAVQTEGDIGFTYLRASMC